MKKIRHMELACLEVTDSTWPWHGTQFMLLIYLTNSHRVSKRYVWQLIPPRLRVSCHCSNKSHPKKKDVEFSEVLLNTYVQKTIFSLFYFWELSHSETYSAFSEVYVISLFQLPDYVLIPLVQILYAITAIYFFYHLNPNVKWFPDIASIWTFSVSPFSIITWQYITWEYTDNFCFWYT